MKEFYGGNRADNGTGLARHGTNTDTPLGLACIYFSGKQKGKQRVPSTLRFRNEIFRENRGCLVLQPPFLETREFP